MITFKEFMESFGGMSTFDLIELIKSNDEAADIVVEDEFVSATISNYDSLVTITKQLPEDLDYDVFEYDDSDDDREDLDDGDAYDDVSEVSEDAPAYELVVYMYNTEIEDDGEDDEDEQLDEVRRVVKVNSKGKRRIKLQCKPGYKFDGKKCVKIAGSELINKRKAILKAIRTKRSRGSGYKNRVARLRRIALRKRKSMGM